MSWTPCFPQRLSGGRCSVTRAGATGCPRLDCHVACSAETLASRTLLDSSQAEANVNVVDPQAEALPSVSYVRSVLFLASLDRPRSDSQHLSSPLTESPS